MSCYGSRAVLPIFRLGTTNVLWVEETRYLGVTLQQNLKFDKQHIISEKVDKASRIIGTIKHTIRTAPEKSKLLAYTSLCRPIMEYADHSSAYDARSWWAGLTHCVCRLDKSLTNKQRRKVAHESHHFSTFLPPYTN